MSKPPLKPRKSNPRASKSRPKAKKPAPAKKSRKEKPTHFSDGTPLPPHAPELDDRPKPPKVYFHTFTGDYYLHTKQRFMRVGKSDLKMHVLTACPNFRWGDDRSYELTDGQKLLVDAQTCNNVDYAGPLSGYPVGIFTVPGGQRVIVTDAPDLTLPPPIKGESCEFIERYLGALLGSVQSLRFFYWLKCARESLERQDRRPGQMWVFAGANGSAKSFAQWLVTQVLGGRSCDVWSWLAEKTDFNGHAAKSPHWMIEETNGSTDPRSRNRLAEKIKFATVGGLVNVHLKGKDIAISVEVFRRLTMSLNFDIEEPQNLMVIPPMAKGFADKVCLSLCSPAQHTLNEDRLENQRRAQAELPAFIRELRKMRIPNELKCARYGVTHYHNPELLAMLKSSEPSVRFLEIIDDVFFTSGKSWVPKVGTASNIHHELRDTANAFEIDKLLHFPGACGTFLGKLKVSNPKRVGSKTNDGLTEWTIMPPPPRDTKTDTLPGM